MNGGIEFPAMREHLIRAHILRSFSSPLPQPPNKLFVFSRSVGRSACRCLARIAIYIPIPSLLAAHLCQGARGGKLERGGRPAESISREVTGEQRRRKKVSPPLDLLSSNRHWAHFRPGRCICSSSESREIDRQQEESVIACSICS